MRFSPESIARACARHPWRTFSVWLLVLAFAVFSIAIGLSDALTTEFSFSGDVESITAGDLVEDRLTGPSPTQELVIVRSGQFDVDEPEYETFVRRLQSGFTALGTDVVTAVPVYYDTQDPGSVSQSRRAMLVPVILSGSLDDAAPHIVGLREVLTDNNDPSFETFLFGQGSSSQDFQNLAEEDLRKGEGIGLLMAMAVLVVVFGAVVAAALPIGLGIVAIIAALGATAWLGKVMEVQFFVPNIITMMGLAVGIDYCLFIVSRYREERRKGLEKFDAIGVTAATANRAMFFSGVMVVLALVGMLLPPIPIFRGLAAGAILVVISAIACALTFLPALLGLLGDRINRLRVTRKDRDTGRRGGFWDRITAAVMARPLFSLIAVAALLMAAAFSWFDIRTGFSGITDAPEDLPARIAFEALLEEFPGGTTSPVLVVIDGDVASAPIAGAVDRLTAALEGDAAFGIPHYQANEAGDLGLVSVPLEAADSFGGEALDQVRRLRAEMIPAAFAGVEARVLVGGETAFGVDFFGVIDRYTPWVYAFVLGLSFVLLTVVFRSIVVPIEAIILNLLSVGAATGLVVLVFQKGFLVDALGFTRTEAIEAWLPLFLFSILFGLSMDYHVFLLTRIRERFDQTADNSESVAHGLRTTGAIITGAAVIMVAVFAGFAAGDLVALQQMGFGLAVAVFLDATLVRSVLVPATMKLLGDRNWYLPRFLHWLPDLKAEGQQPTELVHSQ